MRYERKYPLSGISMASVESFLRMHPLAFSEIFPVRKVNSLYFDTREWDMLEDSLAGVAERMKIRIRWYGEFQTVTRPVLEVKFRRFDTSDKLLFTVPVEQISPVELAARGANWIRELFNPGCDLLPAIFVSYSRSYYGNPDARFRLTLDWELAFRNPLLPDFPGLNPVTDNGLIAELKYADTEDKSLNEFSDHFPFRMGKSSKYVKGMLLTAAN